MDPLTAERAQIGDDPFELYDKALAEGWGDGLPFLPPTERRVRALLTATPYHADDVVAALPPTGGLATVELVAVNAAMAGCEPEALPLVIAALEAISEPEFNLFGISTTTSGVFPMLIVNGPTRDDLGLDYRAGCMGGAGGRGSATIGRAVALCMRNIGGQKVGLTSKSVFGQPARLSGLCFGEWEERSPWPSLAQQHGFTADQEVVTVHAGKGTFPLADVNNDDARDLVTLIAQSMAFPLNNKFLTPTASSGQVVLCLNPIWADRIGKEFPEVGDLQAFIHEASWRPIESWPEPNRKILEGKDRVDERGRVWVADRPDQFVVVVCGGLGNLHAICLPSWGESEIQHVAAVRPEPELAEVGEVGA